MMASTLPVFVIDVPLQLAADAVILLSVTQLLRLTTT